MRGPKALEVEQQICVMHKPTADDAVLRETDSRALTITVDDPEVLLGLLGKVSCPAKKPAKPIDSRVAAL
jgi:hypothetical protein